MRRISKPFSVLLAVLILFSSVSLHIPTKVYGNGTNLIENKSYSSSVVADVSYADSSSIELTDGIQATPYLNDSAWQGRFNAGTYSFTVDLGSNKGIDSFEAGFYKYTGAWVYPPTQVDYKYSNDNINFTQACTVYEQGIGVDIERLAYYCDANSTINARYVKMEVTTSVSNWSFIDEWEVFGGDVEASSPVKLNGTFLQPELADTWTNAEWVDEFEYMQDLGMDHLILQWSANTEFGTSVYPSSISGLAQNTTNDVLEKVLEMGELYNFDIYIGLQLNHEWFVKYTSDKLWLDEEADLAGQLIDEISELYGDYSSLKGWYLSFEVDNWNLTTTNAWQSMVDFYNEVTSVANVVTPDLPIMISPFYNVYGGLTTSQWETMWNYILSRTNIDIIALQDGIGAAHAVTSDLAGWFLATKNAINTSSPSTQLWADTETFNMDFKPMSVQHMVNNMLTVEPYVENYTSFSFNHYMSPQEVNPLFYYTYKNYIDNGIVDSNTPTSVTNLTPLPISSMKVSLNWTAATDDVGVVGYQIYRNSELVDTTYTASTVYIDDQLTPFTTYTYSIKAFDAAGNVSPLSASVSVTTTAGTVYSNNIALGKSYSSSMAADVMYTDSSNVELTNGTNGAATYVDAAWQGRNTDKTYSFVIDLGTINTIKEVNANFLQVKSVYVLLPKQVKFSISSDNITFTSIDTVLKPAISSSDQAKKYRLTDLAGVSGRYLKVEVTPASSAWTFIDEIEVRN